MISEILSEPVRLLVLATAQALGDSVGGGIMVVPAMLRLALLPLTVRLALRARAQQAILTALGPQLSALKERYAAEPEELARQTFRLYQEAGYRPFDVAALVGNLAQLPILAAMYGALRTILKNVVSFWWVGNLARPDALLAIIAVLVTAVASYAGGQSLGQPPRALLTATGISALIAAVLFWHASAGLVLSWGASSAMTLVQTAVVARRAGARAPAA